MRGISLLIAVLLVCLQIATLVSATLVGENHLRVNKQSHLLVQVTAALEEKRRGEAVEGEFDDELLRSSSGTPHAEITLKITSTDVGKSAYGVKAEQKKTTEQQDNDFCKLDDEIKDKVRERKTMTQAFLLFFLVQSSFYYITVTSVSPSKKKKQKKCMLSHVQVHYSFLPLFFFLNLNLSRVSSLTDQRLKSVKRLLQCVRPR